MGYRWYNGRLLTDDEYYSSYTDLGLYFNETAEGIAEILNIVVPSAGLMYLGYTFFENGGTAMLFGLIIGICMSYFLHSIIQKIFYIITWIVMICLLLGVLFGIGYLIYQFN